MIFGMSQSVYSMHRFVNFYLDNWLQTTRAKELNWSVRYVESYIFKMFN